MDYVDKIEIGYHADADKHTDIECMIGYADRIVPYKGDLVNPIDLINVVNPGAVGHAQRYHEIIFEMDTWNYEALMTQQVTTAIAASRAFKVTGKNCAITHFKVTYLDIDGTTVVRTFEADTVYLSRLRGKVTNRKVDRAATVTATFISIGEMSEA